MDGNCNIEISLEDVTDIEKWENSLEINFNNVYNVEKGKEM